MIVLEKHSQDEGVIPAWHSDFLAMLPAITRYAQGALRHWTNEAKQDLLQEVVANCFVAHHRLVERGKSDLAFPSVLVRFAVRRVFSGRRVGSRLNTHDVMSRHVQQAHGITVARLDHLNDQDGEWKLALVEDRKAGPAETAAARMDIASWLSSLSSRDRQIAEMLAGGEKTSVVAKSFGLTASRISNLRALFERSWQRLQDGLGGHGSARQAV